MSECEYSMCVAHYAHSLPDTPLDEWQLLADHLEQVADLADSFSFRYAPGWGRLAGLWHDAGKYRSAFQNRIGAGEFQVHVSTSVDHKSVGALLAHKASATLLAFPIAGHHGGMPNRADLASRLALSNDLLTEAVRGGLPESLVSQPVPPYPEFLVRVSKAGLSLWVRFIFSALVDADFLDTESFYEKQGDRFTSRPSITDLKNRLDDYIDSRCQQAAATPVNAFRASVLAACRKSASGAPGLYTLTVPTGGGKTLSSLSFALSHAQLHSKTRIIVVIPYTSIIEQTAAVYREAFGSLADEAVVEHHTNVNPERETPANRLACENWDAPIVVTTSVQFFESLFSNKPSRCRKLHNIANSVVVLDEVQTFPAKLLSPIRHVLAELTANYGVTAVLCTATQPVLLEHAREIVPDVAHQFEVVSKRCEILLPESEAPTTWSDLSEQMRAYPQVMTIVHRRDDAQALAQLVGPECLHLSARMCAAHRSSVLAEVKRRLSASEPCRLVSTQLVEAGVDVDFPEVFRAFAGADSLAQAAGRCNREGRGRGRLHVFNAPSQPPRGILRTAERLARVMHRSKRLELTQPSTFAEFFTRLYGLSEQDSASVMAAESEQRFEDAARGFQMIDDVGEAVVAPHGAWDIPVAEIRSRGPRGISRMRMRSLQPFFVNLYPQEIKTLCDSGALERVLDTVWVVVPGFRVYDDRWGFSWKGAAYAEPESLLA